MPTETLWPGHNSFCTFVIEIHHVRNENTSWGVQEKAGFALALLAALVLAA